jgi:hypothetical protein
MRPIMKRREAAAIGLVHYYTGKPCIKGHIGPRYTNGGACVACSAEKGRSQNAAKAAAKIWGG